MRAPVPGIRQKAPFPLETGANLNDAYWSEVLNKQPFCASYWGGRPVQDQMYSTAYLSTAGTGTGHTLEASRI